MVAFWVREPYHRMIMIEVTELELKNLRIGADFILTIPEPDADPEDVHPRFRFTIKRRGRMPLCEVELLDEFDHVEAADDAILLGSGRMTTDKNNPLLRGDWFMGRPYRDSAFMPDYGHLAVEENVMIADPADDTGAWFDLSVCTQIQTRDSVS